MSNGPQGFLLRVTDGPSRASFALVRPGFPVLIGRERSAALWVDDPKVSRRHAEVNVEDGRCWLRDLGSTNGTLLNGQAVSEAEVTESDIIEVGNSRLRLDRLGSRETPAEAGDAAQPDAAISSAPTDTVERPPARAPQRVYGWIEKSTRAPASKEPVPGSLYARLLGETRREAAFKLYAVIDAARDDELGPQLASRGYELYTLFEGDWAASLGHVGPCLVPATEVEVLLESFSESVGEHIGILLESTADLENLLSHLRSVFVVQDEEDQEFFFRYYDPRVLTTFLPTCTPEQLREFFGPIERIYVESEEIDGFRALSLQGNELRSLDLKAA
jgi:pSer/pThr/pTyr-binding forkhead associated (FHA) protein